MPRKHQKKIKKKLAAPPQSVAPQTVYNVQQTLRVGLFVTKEFDKVTERCKARVYSIAQDCRNKNRRFRDSGFDLDDWYQRRYCLHGPDCDPLVPKFAPSGTRRVSQIFENPQFYIDGVECNDVVQGRMGNCWFLSALAAVGTKPGLLEKLCVARDEKVGIYGFVFCRDGEWDDVIIDDQLFTITPSWEALHDMQQVVYHNDRDMYEKIGRKGGKTLYFARSAQENETWVPLFEKAYAKFHGDYQSLEGGKTREGIEDLTGGVSEVFNVNDVLDTDLFWKELMRANEDLLFSCAILGPKGIPVWDNEIKGIQIGHAYAVLKAVEFCDKRFLKIRNPWGRSEWNGPWCDGNKEWEGKWLGALGALDHKFGNDGVFIMEYGDFLQHWEFVERTQLFDDTWVQSSHWLDVVARPLPSACQFGDVSFTFSLPERSETILVLSQSDKRFYSHIRNGAEWSFDFALYMAGSQEVIGFSTPPDGTARSVTSRIGLDAGDYVVHVRLDRSLEKFQAGHSPLSPRSTSDISDQVENRSHNMAKWNEQKMSKVWSQLARSKSIAANFDAKIWKNHLVQPLENFAGQNLFKIHSDNLEKESEERKIIEAKIAAGRADRAKNAMETSAKQIRTVVQPVQPAQPAPEAEAVVQGAVGELNGDSGDDDGRSERSDSTGASGDIRSDRNEVMHVNISCDGCKSGPIIGNRWKCMTCTDYDLCDNCHTAGVHHHQMLKIEHPADAIAIENAPLAANFNSVLLGFRVFSKKHAPVQIAGQLSNGQVVTWKHRD